jgi:hypothetical protein
MSMTVPTRSRKRFRVGQPRSDRQNQQDTPDERDAVAHDAHDVLPGRQVVVHESLDKEGVERGDGRSLGQGHNAGQKEPQHDHRQEHLELGVPHRPYGLAGVERHSRRAGCKRCADAEHRDETEHHESWQESSDEELLHRRGDAAARRDDREEHQR